MNILEKYIGRAITTGVLSVLGVLMVLYAFMGFVNEFDQIGRHQYTLWHAIGYSLLRLPERLFIVALGDGDNENSATFDCDGGDYW